MGTYYNASTGQIRLIDAALFAAWVAAGNPKATGWLLIPDQPSPAHTWNGTQWVAPDPAVIAAQRAAAIRAERDRRILAAGYKVGAHWFHSDLVSRGQQTGLVIMGANIPAGLTWKTMGGVSVPMTQQLAGQIFQAAAMSDATLHAVADAAIAAGTEPSAVQWPPAFGD